eukprot:jgi/Ulvmu1/6737/UM030_0072.1
MAAHANGAAVAVAEVIKAPEAGAPAKRERWASRSTFIIASVGSAIGLGNVWRFPFLMYKHGGGAFLIPYAVFLLATGIPLLQTELALGRLFQKGDIEAFGAIHKRCRGVGAISIVGGFGIVTYYSAIIAWAAYFVGASFEWPLPWAAVGCGGDAECAVDPQRALPLPAASTYFTDTLLNENPDSVNSGVARVISGPLLGCLLFTWACCYFCIWKGVKSVGVAARLTVTLPWLFLTALIIYNATLEGSGGGVKAYIGEWDMSVLNGEAWSDAAGQIFFTLAAAQGIMSAYGSFAPASTNVWADNNYICYINCFTSVMAGFAVSSLLGNVAWRQREVAGQNADLRVNICAEYIADQDRDILCPDLCELCRLPDWRTSEHAACCGDYQVANVAEGGIMLAFAVYPAAMQFMSRGAGTVLSVLWFGTLFMLGIDSMFALVEGVSTVVTDTPRFRHLRKEAVAAAMCAVGFVGSVGFVSDIGRPLLGAVDHYIVNYGLFVTGALEAVAVSWVWGYRETKQKCGRASALVLTWGFLAASTAGVALSGCLHYATAPGANIGIGAAAGTAICACTTAAAFACRADQQQPLRLWLDAWVFAGTRNLRNTFQSRPSARDRLIHIITFDVPIKYICPPALLGLFVNQAIVDATAYSNGYEDYPDWLHSIAGVLVLGLMFGALIGFAICPDFWDVLGVDKDAGQHVANYDLVQQEPAVADEEAALPPQPAPMFAMPEDDGWGAE